MSEHKSMSESNESQSPRVGSLFSFHGAFLVLITLGACFLIAGLQTMAVAGAGIAIGLIVAVIGIASSRAASFQFSIRGMLLLITAVAVFAVWNQHWFISTELAIEKIKEIGGEVDVLENPNGKSSIAQIIRKEIEPSQLKYLRALPNLQHLDLDYTEIGDSGLGHIGKLTDLEWLDIEDTGITDTGLSHLTNLHKLQRIIVDGNKVSDKGLMHLAKLKSLQSVRMLNTNVTQKGVAAFRKINPNCSVTIQKKRRVVSAQPN